MDKNIKQIINLTKKLVAFETTNDNFEERKNIIDFIIQEFKGCDVHLDKFLVKNVPSLVITLNKTKSPKLFLNGHLDVVFAQKKDFKAFISKDKIYGRGTGDMKAACAVMIEIMKYFSRLKERPNIGLMLTTDEEMGGENGAGYLVKKMRYAADIVLVPDGGSGLDTIVIKEKGALQFRVWANGISAHGSRPFLGDNAIEKLMHVYFKIKKQIPDIKRTEWKNTMNLGKIFAGEAINKVPDYAEMYLDIRLINEKERGVVLNKIKKITKNFEVVTSAFCLDQNIENEYLQLYKKTAEREIGKKVKTMMATGASDARFFSEKNIPVILTKIDCANIHAKEEWADINAISKFYNILKKFIEELS